MCEVVLMCAETLLHSLGGPFFVQAAMCDWHPHQYCGMGSPPEKWDNFLAPALCKREKYWMPFSLYELFVGCLVERVCVARNLRPKSICFADKEVCTCL